MNAHTRIETQTLLGALAAALPELEAAKKSSENAAFKSGGKVSKYADLGSVIEAIRPIAAHGLWFRQVSHEADKGVLIETFYIHDSGELSAGKVFVPADKANAQGYGSAQTYARRYGLQMAFGLATEDDDGNAASAAPAKQQAEGMPDAEWAKLTQLLQATGADTNAMLKHYGVNNLRLLNHQQYGDAIEKLNVKLAEKAKAETNNQAFGELDDAIRF